MLHTFTRLHMSVTCTQSTTYTGKLLHMFHSTISRACFLLGQNHHDQLQIAVFLSYRPKHISGRLSPALVHHNWLIMNGHSQFMTVLHKTKNELPMSKSHVHTYIAMIYISKVNTHQSWSLVINLSGTLHTATAQSLICTPLQNF